MIESRVEALLRSEVIEPLSEQVRTAHKQQLRAMMAADAVSSPTAVPTARRAGRWWRRGGAGLLAAGLIVAGAGAATAYLTHAQPDDPAVVRCFSVAAPPFTGDAPGSYDASLGAEDGSLGQSAAVAIELCGYGWAEGRLPWPESKPPGYVNPEPQTVPELQACILPDGIVGVFPGGDLTCSRLGLPRSSA